MPRIPRYWLFQLTGWFSFALINSYIAILTGELTRELLVMNGLVSMMGCLLSHQFRNYIIRKQLFQLPTERLLFRLALLLVVLSALYNVLYYLCLYLVYRSEHFHLSPGNILGSFISVYFLFSFWTIIYFSWTYVESNRRKLIEHLQMESAMKDLELKTIRSNLQPHFIFNSLNSIRALIDENPGLARDAITHISNILRSSISQQESTDTLERELMLVDDYLALEKIRFEERLSVSKQIDPATLSIHIPTMMLQTLVENAIKHGISMAEAGGKIEIHSTLLKGTLLIEISNSGSLQQNMKHSNSLGFGLKSTRQRLQLQYGNRAGMRIFEQDGQVKVQLIIQTENSDNHDKSHDR